jgi:hypothetical protein
MEEIWKEIEGTDGKYHVSSHGRVKSYAKYKDGIILKMQYNKKGYLVFPPLKKFAHRLVANAFLPNSDKSKCVNHINGVRDDNRLNNLEWVSHRENKMHSVLRANPNQILGVFKLAENKYRANTKVNGKSVHIGLYTTPELAHQAVKEFFIKHNIQNRYI